jgi:hypothetical protein
MSEDEPLREDPVGLIGQALTMGADFPGPAEDVLLSWILKLDQAVDPVAAAATLIQRYAGAEGPLPEGEAGKLIRLLRETASCSPDEARRRRSRRGRGPRT